MTQNQAMVSPEFGGFCGHASRLYWLFGRSQFSFYHGISAWQKKTGEGRGIAKKKDLGFWLGFSTLVEMVGCKRGQSQFFVGAFSKGQGLPCLGPIVSSHKLWEKQSCSWHAESRIFILINYIASYCFFKRDIRSPLKKSLYILLRKKASYLRFSLCGCLPVSSVY